MPAERGPHGPQQASKRGDRGQPKWTCPCMMPSRGYEHTTIQDIVDALGMSRGYLPPLQVKEISWTGSTTATTKTWVVLDPAKLPGPERLGKTAPTPSATFSPTRPSGR